MDEVGSEAASLLGFGGGGSLSMLFAATYPARSSALVLVNGFARLTAAEGFPWGRPPALEEEVLDVIRSGWGQGVLLDLVAPSRVGDEAFRQWWARYQRIGGSPGSLIAIRRMLGQLDVRDVLPSIRVPTLVLHRVENAWVRAEHGRYLAEHIPGATFVELQGVDYLPFLGDADAVLEAIEGFVAGLWQKPDSDRVLATILFTDIVGSTRRAAELGDRAWSDLLARHHAIVRQQLERLSRARRSTPPATASSPPSTARPAPFIAPVPYEMEFVRWGSRFAAGCTPVRWSSAVAPPAASPSSHRGSASSRRRPAAGEVLTSSIVKDLVGGSGIAFADRGTRELEGVPGRVAPLRGHRRRRASQRVARKLDGAAAGFRAGSLRRCAVLADLLFLLAAIWGASYLFIEVGVEDIPPAALTFLRILIAAVLLVAYVVHRLGADERWRSFGPPGGRASCSARSTRRCR